MTKAKQFAADVSALLRARTAVLWVVTREEARAEQHLIAAAGAASYKPRTWDVDQGAREMDGKDAPVGDRDVGGMLNQIRLRSLVSGAAAERGLWIMRDLPAWLAGFPGASPLRQLRNLARSLPGTPRPSAQAIVVLTPSAEVPPELSGHVTVLDLPLPDREEVAELVDAAIMSLPEYEPGPNGEPDTSKPLRALAAPNGAREAAIDAAVGLTGAEAQACYARSLVVERRINPATIAAEKKRIITREKVLEWFDPIPGGLDAIGGLDLLKAWLLARTAAFTPEAKAYGLPPPRGVFLAGISGCGKSLTAKAVATAWKWPLVKLDLNALKNKFVGSSEERIRKAFAIIDALGRVVVWADEIEKALAGATGGTADGGVSADALGTFLTWMQERKGESFVIATANDISNLPPELLRKGRFDDIFWIDLPTVAERVAILAATLTSFRRDGKTISLPTIAEACKDFTGSEIAAIVPEAMFAAFADGAREINTNDLLNAAGNVTPLAETMGDKIKTMRAWAKGKARPATSSDIGGVAQSERPQLDI